MYIGWIGARRPHGIVAVVCLALTACDDGPFGVSDMYAMLQTDQASYTAEVIEPNGNYTLYGFKLVAHFTNSTDWVLYLGRCYPDTPLPLFGFRAVGVGDDVPAGYGPFWACVGHDAQFRIEPGQTRVDTINVVGPNAWDGVTTEPLGVMEGFFRLYYDVRYCPAECPNEAPEAFRMSNLFRVTQVSTP